MQNSESGGSGDTLLKPGQQIRPVLTPEIARQLIKNLYGLEVLEIKELNSYDDKNFLVKVNESHNNPHLSTVSKEGYVLKVTNSLDSQKPSLIDGQNEMMVYLGQHGILCQQPVKNLKGEMMSLEEIESEASDEWTKNNLGDHPHGRHIVRLLTFVPGKLLYDVPYTAPLFYQCGKYLAKMDIILKGFSHKAYENHWTVWSMRSIPKLKDFLFAVTDDKKKQLVTEVVDAFSSEVLSKYDQLEKGMIHGDFNEQNIIVHPLPDGDYNVAGILDMGDTHYSCYLFELALCICYLMIDCKTMDPLLAGGHMLAGYITERQLPEEEFQLLKISIAGRLSQSLVMGAYSYLQDPGNEYLLTTAKNGWLQLERLWSTPSNELYAKWRDIMKTYVKD